MFGLFFHPRRTGTGPVAMRVSRDQKRLDAHAAPPAIQVERSRPVPPVVAREPDDR